MEFSTAKFSGHQSFPFRNTWLTKGIINCDENSEIFREDDALVILGVGKNMVDSIKYWCLATQVLEINPEIRNNRGRYLRPTPLGNKIFLDGDGWDRYLEDEGTLWLLHYLLATNPEWATTVYYAFNEMPGLEFTRNALERSLIKLDTRISKRRTSENTIRRDLNVFIRMYAGSHNASRASIEDSLDCPLAELGLVHEEPTQRTYAFSRGPKDSLPDAVVFYAIWNYAQDKGEQRTFTFDELAYRPLGPGRVFKLDEPSLAERLEHLAELTAGALQLTETAGYRQVLITEDIKPMKVLDDYYKSRWGEATDGRS
jgi:hypothetical protein